MIQRSNGNVAAQGGQNLTAQNHTTSIFGGMGEAFKTEKALKWTDGIPSSKEFPYSRALEWTDGTFS